jgi:hypothetical protein
VRCPTRVVGTIVVSIAAVICASCSSPTTPTQAATVDPRACRFDGGAGALTAPSGPVKRYLVDLNVDADRCTDRVTFSFEPSAGDVAPGYTVGYRDGPFRDASDRDTTVRGSAYIVVWVRPAAIAHIDLSGVTETYRGPHLVDAGNETVTVRQVALYSAFEGNLRFAIGLDQPAPFRVRFDDAKLVVEVGDASAHSKAKG